MCVTGCKEIHNSKQLNNIYCKLLTNKVIEQNIFVVEYFIYLIKTTFAELDILLSGTVELIHFV